MSENILSQYINGYKYLPISNSALDFYSINMIINDIAINNRKSIIEFGSGVSTIIIARFLKKEKIVAHIYSVDNNINWHNSLIHIIKEEELTEYITFIHAELCVSNITLNKLLWFNTTIIQDSIGDNTFDMVIIDGPEAHRQDLALSRYPALPFIYNYLTPNYSIFIDDANRVGEMKIIEMWGKMYKIQFKKISKTLGVCVNGESFNFIL
ncbi:MAG: class I SAM-dependent methyltransferase [Salinivirgaceae bacterium]